MDYELLRYKSRHLDVHVRTQSCELNTTGWTVPSPQHVVGLNLNVAIVPNIPLPYPNQLYLLLIMYILKEHCLLTHLPTTCNFTVVIKPNKHKLPEHSLIYANEYTSPESKAEW